VQLHDIEVMMKLLVWLFAAWKLLFSGWTTPNTASAGAPISAANYNTYQRDNLTYLFSQRPESQIVYEGVSNYTTTSTSFVAVDTTNLRITKTINSGRVRLEATCRARHSDTSSGSGSDLGGTMAFDFLLDGGSTRVGGTNGLTRMQQGNNGTQQHMIVIVGEFTGLSVGSHTFDLAWKTSGATATIFNSGYPVTMRAVEF
jgi:hypothetical protein